MLDRDIVLNFTLYEIYFSTGPALCRDGRLTVHNFISPYTFCAHHALLNLYPPGNDVKLSLLVDLLSEFNFTATFSVIARHIVHSINYHEQSQVIVAHFFRNEAVLYAFKISTKKSHCIILDLLSHYKYIIHNGPGLFSTSVKNSPQRLHMSTCQCIVTMFSEMPVLFDSIPASFFGFSSHLVQVVSAHVINNTEEISMPIQTCHSPICVIFTQAEKDRQINITIVKMNFLSDNMLDCLFGGLVAAEELETGNQESATVCDNVHPFHVPRMLYSYNGSLLIVMYWYAPHSVINATLKVSKTKCKAVRINSCEFYKACQLGTANGHKPCTTFQHKLNQLTDVGLSTYRTIGNMFFNIPPSTCAVAQVFSQGSLKKTARYVEWQCNWVLSLKPYSVDSLGSEYRFHVMGFFEIPKERRVYATNEQESHLIALTKELIIGMRDTFTALGPEKYFMACHFKNMTPICLERHRHFEDRLLFFSTEKNSTQSHFSFFTSVLPPRTLQFQGHFYQHSKTWVDIIIFHHVEKEQSSLTMLSVEISETLEIHNTQNKGIFMLKMKKTGETDDEEFDTILAQMKVASRSTKVTIDACDLHLCPSSFYRGQSQDTVPIAGVYTYIWKSTVRLFSEDYKHMSLPGVMHYLRVEINDTLPQNYSIETSWLQGEENVLKYTVNPCDFVVGDARRRICLNVIVHIANQSIICFTFVISKSQVNGTHNTMTGDSESFLQLRKTTYSGNIRHVPDKWSWHEAFHFCRDIGDKLPQFTSKENLYTMISIFKFPLDMEAVEAIFIGLHQDNSSQVRITACKQ